MSKVYHWLSFAYHDSTIRTAIHFFPYSGSISATYPVELTLSIFGNDFETVQITMEGARLSQPDGIILDQVFPALLSQYQGLYGVSLQLKCPQQAQLDLSNSVCLTELLGTDQILRFEARYINSSHNFELNGICRSAEGITSSLVAINASGVVYNNGLPAGLVRAEQKPTNQLLSGSVQELKISDDYLKSGLTQITSQGEMLINNYHLQTPAPEVVYFYLERNRQTNALQNVQTL